jgi:hypothetical protein
LRSLLTSAIRSPQTKKIPKASAAKSVPAKTRLVRKPRKPLVTTKQPKGMTRCRSNGLHCSLCIIVAFSTVSPNDTLRTPPRISLGGASSTKLVPFDQLRRLSSLLRKPLLSSESSDRQYIYRDDCATVGASRTCSSQGPLINSYTTLDGA